MPGSVPCAGGRAKLCLERRQDGMWMAGEAGCTPRPHPGNGERDPAQVGRLRLPTRWPGPTSTGQGPRSSPGWEDPAPRSAGTPCVWGALAGHREGLDSAHRSRGQARGHAGTPCPW